MPQVNGQVSAAPLLPDRWRRTGAVDVGNGEDRKERAGRKALQVRGGTVQRLKTTREAGARTRLTGNCSGAMGAESRTLDERSAQQAERHRHPQHSGTNSSGQQLCCAVVIRAVGKPIGAVCGLFFSGKIPRVRSGKIPRVRRGTYPAGPTVENSMPRPVTGSRP